MAIALLPEHCTPDRPAPPATATLVLLCSPIRAADGSWRMLRQEVGTTAHLSAVFPPGLQPGKVIVNGRSVPPAEWDATPLQAGDECLLIPAWGGAFGLIGFAIALALSVGLSYASYALFPPAKAHQITQQPEEPSFGFEGIRTAVGPGPVVPVIYGRHRVGGELLSESVDQAMVVLDNGSSLYRVNAVSSPATLSFLLGLGEGPVSAIDPSTILANGQPISNFPGVEIWTNLGSATQQPLPGFQETRNTFADGRPIAEASSSIVYTTTQVIDAYFLNITFQSGLYAFSAKGEKVDNVVSFQTRFRNVATGLWGAWQVFTVSANRTSVVRFGIRKEGLERAIYEIELQVINVQSVTNAEWQPTLESVTEVQHSTQAYPLTATLGLRALATDALNSARPNITVEVLGRLLRVGSFSSLDTWSDNPAWCVMDFLTNTRYGLGWPDAWIDLAGFQAWANYCDELIGGEKRHTLNYVLDRDTRAQQALMEMMAGSRTILVRSGGLWTPRPTRNETPVQLLSWTNCTDLTLTYTRDLERINVMEARFANEDTDFAQDVLTWPPLEQWPAEVRKTSLEVRGVTKPSRITREMQFALNRRKFETMTLEATFSLEALVLQPHDLFRFSHPLPGWGVSGRIQAGSNTSLLQLDEAVTFSGGGAYVIYVRQEDGTVEMKPVLYPGEVTTHTIVLLAALAQIPMPRTSTYAFGKQLGAADTAIKVFRAVAVKRTSRNSVQLQAIVHNPSIYDEPEATPLPVTTELFNPLGPPPGLTSLILTEVTRIQASGASLRVVNVSWDVAGLSRGYAPYGGATISRRTVQDNGMTGNAQAGQAQAALIQAASDLNVNFQPLTQLQGHILDFDDYTVQSGLTYVYRVVAVSARGVPNMAGAREAVIHVAGPTTPGFFPGTVPNLRLRGQLPGDTIWEGRDVHIEWDAIAQSTLFSETFFVQDYIVEVWAPNQLYLLRRTILSAGTRGQTMSWTYTLEHNSEDHVKNGQPGPGRTLLILVWARTNTDRVSLQPAQMTVTNPPPDMSNMVPEVQTLFEAAELDFSQFREPRDFSHYEIYLGTTNPPSTIYNTVATAFTGTGFSARKTSLLGLTPLLTYYVFILPYDTFGVGLQTATVSFVPAPLSAESLDTIPPSKPTGLVLTTGTTVSADGTIVCWVRAAWNRNPESDLAGYQVHFRVAPATVPTVFFVGASETSVRLESVPGHVTVFCRILAYDRFDNILPDPFTDEVSIVTAGDTVPPAPASNLLAVGDVKSIHLLWTPPADLDYDHCEVWASQTNAFGSSSFFGTGRDKFTHGGQLGPNATWYFWLKSVDTSGNVQPITHPAGLTAGVAGTTGQLDDTYISSLVADKIQTGHLRVLVELGIANNIFLDGVNHNIAMYDAQSPQQRRVLLGKLGPLTQQYGLQLFNEAGVLMWDFATGALPEGITDRAITSAKIRVGALVAEHLDTSTLFVRAAAQIANAIITDAHITNLDVGKLLTGILGVFVRLGVGGSNIFLDGPNRLIYVYDDFGRLRVQLGKMGGGSTDYGLQIFSSTGALMYDFTTGAQTIGIAPNAVTESLSFSSAANVVTNEAVTAVCGLTMGALNAGDQLWVTCKLLGSTFFPDSRVRARLHEDNALGAIVDETHYQDTGGTGGSSSMYLQTVYTAPTALGSKSFAVSMSNMNTTQNVQVNNVKMIILKRQR